MREDIIKIYNAILDLNLQINSLLIDFPKDDFEDFNEKLQELIDLKGKFIQELMGYMENSAEELQKIIIESNIMEISGRIEELEKENLLLIQEKKGDLSKEINKTNKSAKALSAYKFNKETEPRIIDETE